MIGQSIANYQITDKLGEGGMGVVYRVRDTKLSDGNMANVDLGRFMAATDPGGSPLDFLNKFHDKIASFHIKDRTSIAHRARNLMWGHGETPIKEMLQAM